MTKKNRLVDEGFLWNVVHNDTKSSVEQSLLLYSEEIWQEEGAGLDLGCGLTDLTRCNIRASKLQFGIMTTAMQNEHSRHADVKKDRTGKHFAISPNEAICYESL